PASKPKPPRYDPKVAEPKWQKYWAENKIFAFDESDKDREVYSVDTPPPTVSGDMHLGHAFSYAHEDFVVRFHRMLGKNVFYPFGTDDNGLATDKLVEKTKKVRSKDFTRDEYRKFALETVKEIKAEFIKDWVVLGMSCDFNTTYSTIDTHCQKTGQKSFLDLYKKGLISRQETPISWCPQCQTAIAQAEFENIEMTSHFNDIVFTCGGKELVIATTRPELLSACVALCCHPDDKRYTKLKGKFAKVPLFDYEVPIITDETVALDKGTGLMMVCTFGDKEDIEKWHKYDLPLKITITDDGRMNEQAQKYEGLKMTEARKQIIADLKESGALIRQEKITHPVNVHERCNTEVEFLKKTQWYIKILDNKQKLLKAADDISWYPKHMKVRYEHWVENLNWDWCISRQRFYGVPFPVWYTPDGKIVVAEEDELPIDPLVDKPKSYKGDASKLIPETDVMDTWNISSVSPQIALDWVNDGQGVKNGMEHFPMSLRPQAHDIIRTWAFYTITKGIYHHGVVPWKNIMISGHVLDPKGQKMSKSKGNVIAPQEVMDKYSADALRFWAAGVKLGDDLPYMEKDVLTGQKTITKLFNASRFSLMHLEDFTGYAGTLEVIDRWLISKLHRVIKEATDAFEQYEYSKTRLLVDKFFWQTYCDQYLELAKSRLYNTEEFPEARASGQFALHTALGAILKMLAPIMPHITEEIYQQYHAKQEKKVSIHISDWPKFDETMIDEKAEAIGDEVVRAVEAVRKFKSDKQLSLRTPLKKLVVTSELDLSSAESDLISVSKA
ncbi:valine--tRNA ligase, partial [Candidatus Woesearchaeota archaeon]|nr:valine--tRNA ligase [Candidatus Woesearchaeota archaeon]